MNCVNPIYLKDRREFVPCGKCLPCRMRRSSDWSFRTLIEARSSSTPGIFLTLTYSDDNIPTKDFTLEDYMSHPTFYRNLNDNEKALLTLDYTDEVYSITRQVLSKRDFQLFMYKVRKHYGKGIRYIACGEYGPTTLRPHYHAIFFNLPFSFDRLWKYKEIFEKLWTNGFIRVSFVNNNRIRYIAKYVTSSCVLPYFCQFGSYKPFLLNSRYFGLDFLTKNVERWICSDASHNNFVCDDDIRRPIPRYYIDKCYPDKKGKDLWFWEARKVKLQEIRNKLEIERRARLDRLYGDNSAQMEFEEIKNYLDKYESSFRKSRKL
ncbi:replication initiator protein [Sigmofec virus UA08Rod_6926]|uniref:Replication initiator protein n=1 Tax=Sigmofec virus UA08Rod_6926 TaxID=2929241 RepID=A0A976N0V5_9VIRU|nr:replication initiator protein [Sigmofec virus UA08Rod_6926]